MLNNFIMISRDCSFTSFYIPMHECGAAILFVAVPNLGILVHRERTQNSKKYWPGNVPPR